MTRVTPPADPVALDGAEIRRRLGKRIRELRDERGLTQEALAERAGGRMSAKHVGAVERGKSAPGTTSLVRLAHGLEVTVGELFSTITPDGLTRLPRRTVATVRDALRQLLAFVDTIDRPPESPESAGRPRPPRRPRHR